MDQNRQNIVLIHISRTTWCTFKFKNFNAMLSSLTIYQKMYVYVLFFKVFIILR